MNFESFNDYLLSLNIAQIGREYGFKKVGMNSLYLMTQLLKMYIKSIANDAKEYCELSNRSEVNLIDMLNALSDKRISKESIINYMRESKLKHPFSKKSYVTKIIQNEVNEREAFIQKINCNNLIHSNVLSKNLVDLIPPVVKYFPREFAIKESEIKINNTTEDLKKSQSALKAIEQKTFEEVISANNYFDNFSKKHKRKNSTDISNLMQEMLETDEIALGFSLKNQPKKKIIKSQKQEDSENLKLFSLKNNESVQEYDEAFNDDDQISEEF